VADLTVGGVDTSTFGFALARSAGARQQAIVGPQAVRVPGRGGMRKSVTSLDEDVRQVLVEGDIQGTSVADARSKLDAFLALLGTGPVALIFGDQPGRSLTAELQQFEVSETYGPEHLATRVRVRAAMLALDPYFYDTSNTVVSTTTAYVDLPLGTGVVRPAFKVTGAATNPTITVRDRNNATIFTVVFASYTLGGGVNVIVNADTMTVLEGSTNRIDKCSTLQFPVLDPRIHALYSASDWPNANVSSGTLEVTYKKAWR
jgi:hypothetical protein